MLLGVFLSDSVTVSSEFMIGFLQQKISFLIKLLRLRHTQAKIQMFFRYAHELSQLHFIYWNSHQLFRDKCEWQSPPPPFPYPRWPWSALSALSYDGYHNILMDFLPRRRMDTVGSCCPHLTWLRSALPASAAWQHLQKRSRSWHFLPPPALSPPPLSTAQQWALHTELLIHLLLSTLLGWTPSGKQQTPYKIPIQKWYPHFRMHCFLYFHLSLWLCPWKLLNTSGNLK